MQTWVELLARNGHIVAIVAGVIGAVVAHAIASRIQLDNGFRLIAAVGGFAALFALGRSALGQRSESRVRNTMIESAMFSRPEFRALSEKDTTFRTRVRAFLDSLPHDASLDDVREKVVEWTREQTTPPLAKYAAVAADTTATALAAFFADAMRELQGNPTACIDLLHGVLDSYVPAELSSHLQARHRALTRQVVAEGRRSPQARVDSLAAIALGRQVTRQLVQRHGEVRAREVMALIRQPPAEERSKPREMCAAATALYSVIAAMPPSKGGRLMRYMLDTQPRS